MSKTFILSRLNFLQEQKRVLKFWNITWEQGLFISNLVDVLKPKRVLEIGTSNGFSTLWLSLNLPEEGKILTFEVCEERFLEAKKNFDFCKLSFVECQKCNVFDALPSLDEKFDFVFVDAEQENYLQIVEILIEKNLLVQNFVLLFDNILNHKSTVEFTRIMQERFETEIIDIGGGMLFAKSKI